MFTGIIEELGQVEKVERSTDAARLTIRGPRVVADAGHGDSISVNGVCLTVVERTGDTFTADVMAQTLLMSTLDSAQAGSPVNLERAALVGDRLGGHIVQGHVDGPGEFLALDDLGGGNWWLRVRYPTDLDPYLVFKGSVAIDGISLTIAELAAGDLSATIIPHTFRNTTLGGYRPGARVNIECDILAKHVEKLIRKMQVKDGLNVGKLREMGY
jgi:riboflavin synthase